MDENQLLVGLSEFGTVQILKEGVVFTLLMTGTELSQWKVVSHIQALLLDYCGDRFPLIEAIKNDKDFFCMILKPKL